MPNFNISNVYISKRVKTYRIYKRKFLIIIGFLNISVNISISEDFIQTIYNYVKKEIPIKFYALNVK